MNLVKFTSLFSNVNYNINLFLKHSKNNHAKLHSGLYR